MPEVALLTLHLSHYDHDSDFYIGESLVTEWETITKEELDLLTKYHYLYRHEFKDKITVLVEKTSVELTIQKCLKHVEAEKKRIEQLDKAEKEKARVAQEKRRALQEKKHELTKQDILKKIKEDPSLAKEVESLLGS